ncbi:MAG: hypothetical protein U0840_00295 [Gemmataceae bacterium]
MMTHLRAASLALTVAGACLLIAGCGKSGSTVVGKATYKGTSLTAGTVYFTKGDKDSSPKSGGIEKDGTYKVEELPPGDYKVYVITPKGGSNVGMPMGMPGGKQEGSEGMKSMKGGATGPVQVVEVPEKYGKPDTSGLTTTVKGGKNTFDITLN